MKNMYKKEIKKIEKAQKEIENKIETNPLKNNLDDIYSYVQLLQLRSKFSYLPSEREEEFQLSERKMKDITYEDNKFEEWWEKHKNDTIGSTPKE